MDWRGLPGEVFRRDLHIAARCIIQLESSLEGFDLEQSLALTVQELGDGLLSLRLHLLLALGLELSQEQTLCLLKQRCIKISSSSVARTSGILVRLFALGCIAYSDGLVSSITSRSYQSGA